MADSVAGTVADSAVDAVADMAVARAVADTAVARAVAARDLQQGRQQDPLQGRQLDL
nr:hypothetical protein [Candidatus Sigynarchaeota archaeon]